MPWPDEVRREKQREAQKRYRERHSERIRENRKKWAAENPDRIRAYRLVNRSRRRDTIRARELRNRLMRNFGLTTDQYDGLLAAQKGVCAICGRPERAQRNGVTKRLAVDHNHTTREVRGLLCQNCNTVLGKMDDSPALLRTAAAYLESYGS